MPHKINKIAQMYHAASALSNKPKGKEHSEEEMLETHEKGEAEKAGKKPSKSLKFDKPGEGLTSTIYKRK